MELRGTLFFWLIFSAILSASVVADSPDDKVICHIYGDPHLVVFNTSQDQYWCRTPGEFTLLANEFLQVTVHIKNQTWAIDQYRIEFFKNNVTLPCQIDHRDQQCSGDVSITRPSFNQISILYGEEQIHLSIFEQQSSYDLSIRLPAALLNQSIGLCIEPSENECELENLTLPASNVSLALSQEICQDYFNSAVQLSNRLNFRNNTKQLENALMACINDHVTTGDHRFGISGIHMIVQDGLHRRQLPDSEFELQNLFSVPTVESAIANATDSIASRLTPTPSTSTIMSSTSSEIVPSTDTATRSSAFTAVPSTDPIMSSSTSVTVPATHMITRPSACTTLPSTSTPAHSTTSARLSSSTSRLIFTSMSTTTTTTTTPTTTTSNGSLIESSGLFVLINGILFLFNVVFELHV